MRARDPGTLFSLEDHVCRHCFGRLVSSADAGGTRRYLCSNCGASATGPGPDVLCACGVRLKSSALGGRPVLACMPNPAPTAEFPSLFVAGGVKS